MMATRARKGSKRKSQVASRVVPFKRTLSKGDIGPDVLGLKRALVKAVVFVHKPDDPPITNQYGTKTIEAVRRFQRKAGITVDGIYGLESHKKLMPHYDAYGAHLMGLSKGDQPAITTRQRVAAEAIWGYNNRGSIHYAQIRPYVDLGHRLPQTLDCSSFSTVVYKRANAPDPNARLYDGLGFTGTLAQHGRQVSLSQARPGDLVLYGSGGWPYHHVSVYVGFGRCVSHGSEGGPYLVPIDYRSDRAQIRSYLL